MDVKTRDEATRPLGVIGCVAAGFEMLGQNLWPLALPVLVDLFFWLGPRLSLAPLLDRVVTILKAQPAPDPEVTRQVVQTTQLLEKFGEQFNLFSLLSMLPLLNVPSLLASHAPGVVSPLGEARVLLVASAPALMAWGVVLVPIGLLLGFMYLSSMARRVRAAWSAQERQASASPPTAFRLGEADEPALAGVEGAGQDAPATSWVGRLIRFFLFASGLLVAGIVLVPIWSLLVGVTVAIAEIFGLVLQALSIGLASYIVLHFLFVVHGVLLGRRGLLRAMWESVVLIHTHLPSVVGLVLVVVVIYRGLGYVWSLPSGDSWSLLIGILGNSCIVTALITATFVFYRERIGLLPGRRQVAARS
jgi:hypothetical protein